MSYSFPSESEINELAAFLSSLQPSKLDAQESCSIISNVPQPAAFEEVEQANSLSLTISSKTTIWDVNESQMTDVKPHFESAESEPVIQDFELDPVNCYASDNNNENVLNNSNDFSSISTTVIDNIPTHIFPFRKIQGSPFHLFSVKELDRATTYTHSFKTSKRHAAYYGEFPYSYDNGKTNHPTKPFCDNEYLQRVASYIKVVLPDFCFNSFMVHKYPDGDSFIPHHGDNEAKIVDGSSIVTVSLGETRFIEFQNTISGSKTIHKLCHGDVFVMSKSAQDLYTHSIPQESNSNLKARLIITFRLMSPPKKIPNFSPISSASELSPTSTVTDFLTDLGQHECHDGYVGDIEVSPITPPRQRLNNLIQPKNPSRPSKPKLHNKTPYRPDLAVIKTRTSAPKPKQNVLYISSSMFRHLDPKRLSSNEQVASKLFYPGADAHQMMLRIKKDEQFLKIDRNSISQIFILTGSNNVDVINRKSNSV